LILILTQIADNNPEKDLKLFRELIKFDLCSVKELNEILEKKYEELVETNEELKIRYQGLITYYKKAKTVFCPMTKNVK
jgi:regulator of RNase E activity RraB